MQLALENEESVISENDDESSTKTELLFENLVNQDHHFQIKYKRKLVQNF